MHQLSRKKNIAPRIILSVLYLLFFAVQLNLRYQSIDVSGHSLSRTHTFSKQTIAQSKVSVSEQPDGKSSITTRLNKRYFPGYFYLVQAPVISCIPSIYLERNSDLRPASFLPEHYTLFTFRRGPPSLV
jgi:hypothetical protein